MSHPNGFVNGPVGIRWTSAPELPTSERSFGREVLG